jgi:hypothetical protein
MVRQIEADEFWKLVQKRLDLWGPHAGGCFSSREFPRLNREDYWFTISCEKEGGLPGISKKEDMHTVI